MTEPQPVYRIPQGSVKSSSAKSANGRLRKGLLATYRSQLSAVIETERLMVELGYIEPGQRRVMSREERRQVDSR